MPVTDLTGAIGGQGQGRQEEPISPKAINLQRHLTRSRSPRREDMGSKDTRSKGKGSNKGGKGSQGKATTSKSKMQLPKDCAKRTPPTREHSEGVRFCYPFHTTDCNCPHGAECHFSHRCPRFLRSGEVCLASDHNALGHGV